jgi:hypothetical protein
MLNFTPIKTLLFAAAAILAVPSAWAIQDTHREYPYTNEKSLAVSIDVSFGAISIEQCDENEIAVIDYYEEDKNEHGLDVSYDNDDGCGKMRIKLKEATRFWNDGDEGKRKHHRHLNIRIGSGVPVSFDIKLGACKGDIDLTGLQVKRLKISAGAGYVFIKCKKPNAITADEIIIESGVTKFTAIDLINLNFNRLKFSGGIGSYRLDFDGKFRQNSEAQIEVALGSIVVNVAESVPVKLLYDDSWLSSFKLDDGFEEEHSGEYVTKNFRIGDKHLTIRLEAGVGSVQIQQK